jgi:type I restriction enzyme S subunit
VKCIDEEIPFEIPESWEWCRLGSIVQHNTGKTLDKGRNTGKAFEYITTSNVYWEGFELNNLKSMLMEENTIDRFTVKKGDLLVCEGGDSGRSAVWEYERTICFQNHVHRVRPYLSIESWYVYFFLHKIYLSKEIEQYKKGVAIQSLSGDALSSILLPLPPIKEQKCIIEEVKRCSHFVETIELNKISLEQFITQAKSKILDLAIRGKLVPQDPNDEPASVLLERIKSEHPESKKKTKYTGDNSHYPFMIPKSWEWVQVIDIAKLITGNTPSKENKNLYGFDFPFYKPADLEKGINVSTALDNLSSLGYEISRKLPKNSILVTCIGATIGKVGLIKQEGTCNQQINAIVPYFGIEPIFIYYFCISTFFQTQIKGNASATTLPIINKNKFGMLQITIPPTQEQIRIIKKIEEIFDSLDRIENSIKA